MPLHSQTILKSLIQEEFPSLSAFAKLCGISQSLVWRDCQDRLMSDKRFAVYLKHLSPEGQIRLIRGRIRDILPTEFESLIEFRSSPRLKEDASNLSLLSEEGRSSLDRLAGEMSKDAELYEWVMTFIKKVC